MMYKLNKDKEVVVYRIIMKKDINKLIDQRNPTIVSIESNERRD